MAAAISKALNKEPVDRFESATAFCDAMSVEVTESAPDEKSIVVLPFENLSPDPDNAFFADGLTEELIAELSGMHQLRVISRTSAMLFKDTQKGVPAIARDLNVRYVLEGSVRRAGDGLRITAQLIDGISDSHLWAERYTGGLNDVFDLQEQLSRKIADALRVVLTPDEDRRIAYRRMEDFRAYDALLRARQEMLKLSAEGIERATMFVQQAKEIAGDNPLIYATLARCYSLSYEFGLSHTEETLQRADEHASKALELAPDLGLALFAKAHVRSKDGDFPEVVRLLRRARDVDRNTDTLSFLATTLAMVGRIDEARAVAAEAVALDPFDMYTIGAQASVELLDGQFDSAVSRLGKAIEELKLNSPHLFWFLTLAKAHSGRLEEAREGFVRVAATEAMPVADLSRLFLLAVEGDASAVQAYISDTPVMVEVAKTDELFPIFIANCLAIVGEKDSAVQWLTKAVDWGFCNHQYLEEHNPFLTRLRDEPQFIELMGTARERQTAFEL
jgi:TolB-like protein